MLTTAGLARAAACTIAESSDTVTPERMSTDCGFVRCWRRRMVRLTPAATVPASRITPMAAARDRGKRMKRLSVGIEAPPVAALGLAVRLRRIPGHHELAVRLKTRTAVETHGCLVVGSRPDVAEGHASLAEQPDGLLGEHLTDPMAAMRRGDAHLGHFALEAGAGIMENNPAEADDRAVVIPGHEADVLPSKGVGDRRQVVLDLEPAQLGMVRVVGLLGQVQVDQKRLDLGVIRLGESLDHQCPHPDPMVA